MTINIFPYESLLDRLKYQLEVGKKKVVFLLGSAVSASSNGSPGVWDVDGIVDRIRAEFSNDRIAELALTRELENSGENAYQVSMQFLLGRRGQDVINNMIREAVLMARHDSVEKKTEILNSPQIDESSRILESDLAGWHCPTPLLALAKLIQRHPETLGRLQLTTNFDPLLTIAMGQLGLEVTRSVLGKDGSLSQTQTNLCHIVHLHGYWYGVDTLHTYSQLNQPRPHLRNSLLSLLKNCVIVPVAYGGWDDAFTTALIDVVQDMEARPDVLWTFYNNHDADITSKNSRLLKSISTGINSGRVQLYKGVDCNKLFIDLLESTSSEIISKQIKTSISESLPPFPANRTVSSSSVHVENIPNLFARESIPAIAELIGRDEQIDVLDDQQNMLIALCGIGGQGKSSIAAHYSSTARSTGKYEFVDWRDCRELNDTLQTTLIKMAASFNLANPQQLTQITEDNLAKLLCNHFSEKSGLVVLDNVDQYVDLETNQPLGLLRVFIDRLILTKLKTKIIFTCRPKLNIGSGNSFSIFLKGLTEEDAARLFRHKSNLSLDPSTQQLLCQVTDGHPLWISLIAARCKHENINPSEILNTILSGQGELPERVIISMWQTLNDKQRSVLKGLAELERPMPGADIADFMHTLNFNQFNKAIKVLKSLALVEIRTTESGTELLDLHPLIRQYIRKNFPPTERAKFISKIIFVLDKRISAALNIFKNEKPVELLEMWTHKIDVLINAKELDKAIDALYEIKDSLGDRGLGEELIRLSIRIFEQVDWATYSAKSINFSRIWAEAVKTLVEFEQQDRADVWISRYEDSIEGAGPSFINLCDTKCFRYWAVGLFDQAIFHGSKGTQLKTTSNVDTVFDAAHNLALAMRDGGRPKEALQHFLGSVNEVDVLNSTEDNTGRPGSFYGNIGRCYFKLGKIDNALICYRKSARLLEIEGANLNRGYIRQWVAEALIEKCAYEDGAVFLKAAHVVWNGFVPSRAAEVQTELSRLMDERPELERVSSIPNWRLENRFMQWLNQPL
ncbi:NB-ARC domain-containing protein [Alcaligenaceae bacterium B3P038]|nr:NB-ARC domain-containing protein [Alcaligenaceae bacterium B3P038]